MSDGENEVPPQPAAGEEDAPAAPAPAETLDQTTALGRVMKTALAHDGLARGLHEVCRALEKDQAQLCILADDCNQPDYKKLIESLCAEKNVDLGTFAALLGPGGPQRGDIPATRERVQIAVETNKKLGELAALCKLDAEGQPTKVVGCSSACVIDYGEETDALRVLKGMIKQRG